MGSIKMLALSGTSILFCRIPSQGRVRRKCGAKVIDICVSISSQLTNKTRFGDYQIYPEEPTVGTEQYPPKIYNSWDPNWRGFVGTTFVLILEEFPDLIPYDLTNYMLESLYNTSIGDSYRVGGVDNDNLYPAYSNPSIMRAFVTGWVGRKLNESNMTIAGENYATEVIDLFNRDNTLSEFNSGTYAGVSLFALTLWAKYMPESSVMGQNGGRMIKYTWASLASLYNARLKNVSGPWDRSYGFDMQRYLSILALQMWTLVGKENAPIHPKVCCFLMKVISGYNHTVRGFRKSPYSYSKICS